MTVIVLVSVTLLAFISADSVIIHQRTVSAAHHIQQAFNAAEAGLNYGILYLDKNRDTVTDNQTITGSLSDGSNYSVKFVFKPSKDQIQMESTGNSSDGTVQRNIKEIVKYVSSFTATVPPQPLTVRGSVELGGTTRVQNYESNITVLAGGVVDISGNAATFLEGGVLSSNNASTGPDISAGDSTLSAMDNEQLALTYLGDSVANIQSAATVVYTNSANYNYSTELNGVTGQTISINQLGGEASIQGQQLEIGSSTNPVTIVVDGNLKIAGSHATDGVVINGNVIVTGRAELRGNVVVNGLVMVLGTSGLEMSGTAFVNGSVISGGNTTTELELEGASQVNYDSAILQTTLSKLPTAGGTYNRIAGSWIDS